MSTQLLGAAIQGAVKQSKKQAAQDERLLKSFEGRAFKPQYQKIETRAAKERELERKPAFQGESHSFVVGKCYEWANSTLLALEAKEWESCTKMNPTTHPKEWGEYLHRKNAEGALILPSKLDRWASDIALLQGPEKHIPKIRLSFCKTILAETTFTPLELWQGLPSLVKGKPLSTGICQWKNWAQLTAPEKLLYAVFFDRIYVVPNRDTHKLAASTTDVQGKFMGADLVFVTQKVRGCTTFRGQHQDPQAIMQQVIAECGFHKDDFRYIVPTFSSIPLKGDVDAKLVVRTLPHAHRGTTLAAFFAEQGNKPLSKALSAKVDRYKALPSSQVVAGTLFIDGSWDRKLDPKELALLKGEIVKALKSLYIISDKQDLAEVEASKIRTAWEWYGKK